MEIGKLTKLSYKKKEGFHRGVQQKIRYWQRLATNPARSNESLLWNCHGLGNSRIENELVSLIQAKDSSVVFIAET